MVIIGKWQIYFFVHCLLKLYKMMLIFDFDLVFGVNVRKTRNFPKHKNYSGSVKRKYMKMQKY